MANKHWTFRYKDIAGWWGNHHYNRINGTEHAEPTEWQPHLKPVVFTELGCPAVDKGANRPNSFFDLKSASSAIPYFSNGNRDDSQQRRFLEAHYQHWHENSAMLNPKDIYIWTWDARPYPAFPQNQNLWSDGDNWRTGHWLNGWLGSTTLSDLIALILEDHGFYAYDVSGVSGDITGYVKGEVSSARQLLQPLLDIFQVDVTEQGPLLKFISRNGAALPVSTIETLIDMDGQALWSEQREHEGDFACEAILTSFNPALAYEQASAISRRLEGGSERVIRRDLNAVLTQDTAQNAVNNLLREDRLARRSIRFSLPLNDITYDVGDCLEIKDGPSAKYQIISIEEGSIRAIEARLFSAHITSTIHLDDQPKNGDDNHAILFDPEVILLDLPRYGDDAPESYAKAAAYSKPWRRVTLSSSVGHDGYTSRLILDRPAKIATLLNDLSMGVIGRFDYQNAINLELPFGALSSIGSPQALANNNLIALSSRNGNYELISFQNAIEYEPNKWRLTNLLRGLYGTDDCCFVGSESGAVAVLLDQAVLPLGLKPSERNQSLNWIAEAIGRPNRQQQPMPFVGGIRAQMPLSPVQLRARRNGAGVQITWIRRGRIGADDWNAIDIPLDEPFERYRIEISYEGQIMRSDESDTPSYYYPNALELQDFGQAQQVLKLSICQIGLLVPRGVTQSQNVTVH